MYLNGGDLNVLLLCLIFSIRLFQQETVTHNNHNTRFILKINQWCLPMEKPDFFFTRRVIFHFTVYWWKGWLGQITMNHVNFYILYIISSFDILTLTYALDIKIYAYHRSI